MARVTTLGTITAPCEAFVRCDCRAPLLPAPSDLPLTYTRSESGQQHHFSRPRATGTGSLENGATMSLSDRLADAPTRTHGLPCSVGELLDTLEGAEQEALIVMLGDPVKRDGWPAQAIYDALTAEGHRVGYQTISRHRGGKCRCGK